MYCRTFNKTYRTNMENNGCWYTRQRSGHAPIQQEENADNAKEIHAESFHTCSQKVRSNVEKVAIARSGARHKMTRWLIRNIWARCSWRLAVWTAMFASKRALSNAFQNLRGVVFYFFAEMPNICSVFSILENLDDFVQTDFLVKLKDCSGTEVCNSCRT